ncbi:MAG: ABC transporter substrate-binding protein [Bradyrhizobiaceae bacterium]|nr:MAG: ABC transporter substrate-binding protein [Bradyrhizobiaceae bacterium]
MLSRREFVAGAVAAVAAPRLSKAQSKNVLRFVPRTDLGVLDPIWSSAIVTRNHAFLVYDTLFGLDASFKPQPQMVQGYTVSDDHLTWRLVLRDGLKWHDGEPVLARDCESSIRRWGARDAYGQALLAATNELSCPDDKTILFQLKTPFPFLPNALGKSAMLMPAMMPKRIADVGPGKQASEIIGSGPFRFIASERVPGSKIVYERFAGYMPRGSGEPSRVAGPKMAHFDRVEWVIMPDPGTAVAALQAGEVDWLDIAPVDLVPVLKGNPDVKVGVPDPNGMMPIFRMNHLQAPFNNQKIRQALLKAFDQKEFLIASAGEDPAMWRDHVGFFCPKTPLASDAGLEFLTGPRDLNAAKNEIIAAGYKGEPVVLIVASDFPALRALADVAAETMKKIGMNVDYRSMDWGTVQQVRNKKDPADQGGWSCFCTNWEGTDMVDPAGHLSLRGNGLQSWYGWPTDDKLETLRASWFSAKDTAEEKKIAEDMQREALISVPYIPLGQYFQPTAYRTDLRDMLPGFAMFWNVRRA